MVAKDWWLIGFRNLQVTQKNLNFMLCLDAKTERIQLFAIGFQQITAQNTIRKLESALQKQEKPILLWIEEDSYRVTKTYQNFLKKMEGLGLVDSAEGTEEEREHFQRVFEAFSRFVVNGKTLEETLANYQVLDCKKDLPVFNHYIEKWNQQKLQPATLPTENPPKVFQEKFLEKITKVEARCAELVDSTPFDLPYDEKAKLEMIPKEMEKLTKLVKKGQYSLTKLVEKKLNDVTEQLQEVEKKVTEIGGDVKQLLPTETQKHVPKPLRDPVTEEIFELLVFNAGSLYSYQKEIRQAQLKIAYTLLYFLGLRVNELRQIKVEDIFKLMEGDDLKIILHKTNRSHTCRLSTAGIEKLKELKSELEFLAGTKKFQYLFGKEKPIERKTVIRTMNHDIRATCELCQISETITSHSFRISMISRLLKVTNVQNVADIMGHTDIRTTMLYNRFRLSKSKILKIYSQAEEAEEDWED